ncbi:MAG: leucine-rich repeat protein [Paludibacteraceae bacterium]|nr:leucine-rich repeat protein [Paludibacteraceae bacterium]
MTKSYNLSRWFATLLLLLLSALNSSAVDWLCFTAEKAGSTIWFENEGDNNPNIQYSSDGESWSDWNEKTTITLKNTGDKVYVRGDNSKGFSFNAKKYTHFGMKGNISSSGSVMSLIDPNESSTEIPNSGCFFKLFSDCKSLTQAPELPATILKDSCYYLLFEKCENLETVPELPAMTMAKYCYSSMFSGCSNLTKGPKLPSLTLAQNCYSGMFTDCNNLEVAPELPATELEPYCYSTMFTACEKLKKAPDLPAKKLVDFCYFFMFERCSGLESAKISATELGPKSCIAMFMSCSNMNYIKIDVMTLDNDMSATESWVMGVTGEGIIEFPCGSKYNKYGDSEAPNNFTIKASPIVIFQNPDKEELWRDTIGCDVVPQYPFEEKGEPFYKDGLIFKGWDVKPHVHETPDIYYYTAVYGEEDDIDLDKILCFTALESNCTISYNCMGKPCPDLHFSLDSGKTWKSMENVLNIKLENVGDKVYVRGNNPTGFHNTKDDYFHFTMKGLISASGSVMSLLDMKGELTEIPCDYCFNNLFINCPLTQAPDLPATALTKGCYKEMFKRCYFLQKAPELPAETVKDESYEEMFNGCYSLSEMPKLPATTLGKRCYAEMFVGCTNLTKVYDLPAKKLETACYAYMFTACSKLEEAPALPATELADSCYCFMFLSCENLTKAPELPATTLKTSCYDHMFTNCQNLETVPDLKATVVAENCCNGMFNGCTYLRKAPALPAKTLERNCYYTMFAACVNLKEAPELPATTLAEGCYNSMFGGCMNLEKAPELPATILANGCYGNMFAGCTNLIKAPELPATTLAEGCYNSMFGGCMNLGKAPELPATTLAEGCYGNMFAGCTNLIKAPELPATKLTNGCYSSMFTGCESLNYIKVGVMSLDNDFVATENWVDGIDGPGVFIFPCGSKYDKHGVSEVPDNFKIISSPIAIFQNPDSTVLYSDTINCGDIPSYERCDTCKTPYYGDSLVFLKWDKELDLLDDPDIYYYTAVYEKKEEKTNLDKILRFIAEAAGSEIFYPTNSGIIKEENYPDVQYSIDGGESWHKLAPGQKITLKNVGDTVYLKGYNPNGFDQTMSNGGPRLKFEINGLVSANGSVMSLIDGKGETTVIPCNNCFSWMFVDCDLTNAPILPATSLTEQCYLEMFRGCQYLKEAPGLPATTLAYNCYGQMFADCSSLTIAPELPATELKELCYDEMFMGCENLTQAPKLHATELAESCYAGMFIRCTSLKEAPKLPAIKLADNCYTYMFFQCENLTKCPELPATQLVPGCYQNMFSECSKLDTIKVGVMSLDNDFVATENWVDGIDGPGVFIFPCGSKYDKHGVSEVPDNFKILSSPIVVFQNPDSTELQRDTIGCDVVPEYRGETPFYKEGYKFIGWDVEPHVHETPDTYYYTAVYEEKTDTTVENNWLCFTAEAPESEIWYYNTNNNPDVQYSIDGGKTWKTLEEGVKVTLENKDDKVYFKGNNPEGFSHGMVERTVFKMSGQIAASGSVMSLIDEKGKTKVIPNDFCFSLLFAGCTSLTQAPELPATTLTKTCYEFMFEDCINLTEAPELPATKIFDKSYVGMFMGCRNLKKAPTLPATEMKYRCYDSMFRLCTSLETPPALPATELAQECYHQMFNECTNLKEAPELPATKMAEYCYGLMFCGCENLKIAPKLPATELAPACYYSMFASCINLTQAPEILPATTLESACYSGMFFLCTALEKAPKLPATTLAEGCYVCMFKECSSLTQAPELPATTLAEGCYAGMFNECSSLTQAPKLPAITLTKECYAGMFEDCSSLTQAPELPASELIDSCYLEMFKGCANLNYIKVGVMSLDNEFNATENWVDSVDGPGVFIFPCGSQYDKHGVSEVPPLFEIIANKYSIGFLTSACDSIVYKGTTYYESKEWHDTLSTSYGCDSIIAYKLIVHNSVETNMDINIEDSFVWKDITYTEDATWVDSLQTSFGCDSIVRYNLTIIKKEKKELKLSVDDDELILILPGETENVGYEITGGIGSQYEVRYKGKLICSGDVSNDSTVDLTCAKNMEPGEYIATMEMCDDEGNCAKEDFTFNVMLPDDKEKSYYVKVWNDVVICRNGDGNHVSYQWYKDKKKCEDANLQYFNDKSLLDGEYMVHVTDKDGKSYFIEPIQYETELAGYGITANPSIVEKSAEFTISVTGVSDDDLSNARIVVYRADGIVEKILNEVDPNTTMRLGSGEYIIVLTVNDGKNANCKVLVK